MVKVARIVYGHDVGRRVRVAGLPGGFGGVRVVSYVR